MFKKKLKTITLAATLLASLSTIASPAMAERGSRGDMPDRDPPANGSQAGGSMEYSDRSVEVGNTDIHVHYTSKETATGHSSEPDTARGIGFSWRF